MPEGARRERRLSRQPEPLMPGVGPIPCYVDLYWIPVAAGTSRLQQASLAWWEAFEALRCRRPRATLLHSALKIALGDDETYTLEVAPAFISGATPPLATGPVGVRGADRWRLFRYQLRSLVVEKLPDEEWAVASPVRLADSCTVVQQLLELAPSVPRHTWGRRARGTREMWTSDSTVSWLLTRTGIDLSSVQPPAGGRAPGWQAGIDLAQAEG